MQEPIRIVLPNHFDNTTVNAWLFKGAVNTLVDTGMKSEDSWLALIQQLKDHDLEITEIDKIVITHGHGDHMGLAARISKASGADVWVPEYLYPWAVDLKNQIDNRSRIYDEAFFSNADASLFPYVSWGSDKLMQFWDPLPAEKVKTFKNDDTLQLGDQVWQSIYAPGHCINQVVFYQAEGKQLISADMILRSTPVPYLDARLDDPMTKQKNLKSLFESFERIDALEIHHVYPGHYDQMEDPTNLIAKQVGRIKENIQRCLGWIREGDSTFASIINQLYPNRINDSTFFMAIAILDYLIDEGLIESKKVNDKLEYFPTTETVLSTKSRKSANNEF